MNGYKVCFWLNFIIIPMCLWGMCQNTDEQWWFTAHFFIAIISQPLLAYAISKEEEYARTKK